MTLSPIPAYGYRGLRLILVVCVLAALAIVEPPTKIVPPSRPIPLSFFGMHIHNAASSTSWPRTTIPSWRLWDSGVTWADLQPSKDQWDFAKLDHYVELASQHHTDILLTLGSTPRWASSRPNEATMAGRWGGAAEPRNLADWQNYVDTIANRYRGEIHEYEIWNEPNLKDFYSGNVTTLVTMTAEAYRILKAVDPNNLVVCPSMAGRESGSNYLADFLKYGGGNYCDVIGYHLYVIPDEPEAILPIVVRIREVLKQYGIAGKPIWDTEVGWARPKIFDTSEESAGFVARTYILNWAAGIERTYWYSWDNYNWSTLPMTFTDGKTENSAAKAFTNVLQWLSGSVMTTCERVDHDIWKCQFTGPKRHSFIVMWSSNGTKVFHPSPIWQVSSLHKLSGTVLPVHGDIQLGPDPVLLD